MAAVILTKVRSRNYSDVYKRQQTHAIQDKVDEVATAVEEIGNSMTLTLTALAEGKQLSLIHI